MPAKKKDTPKSKTMKDELSINYPENLPITYSSHAQMVVSNLDVTIDFGIRHYESSGKNLTSAVVQINNRVIMSIQQAKLFSDKLSNLIKGYENDFGKIQTEPKKKK